MLTECLCFCCALGGPFSTPASASPAMQYDRRPYARTSPKDGQETNEKDFHSIVGELLQEGANETAGARMYKSFVPLSFLAATSAADKSRYPAVGDPARRDIGGDKSAKAAAAANKLGYVLDMLASSAFRTSHNATRQAGWLIPNTRNIRLQSSTEFKGRRAGLG
jgi:hypothetical protein